MGDEKHLGVAEAEIAQHLVGGPHVEAAVPRATAAIDDDAGVRGSPATRWRRAEGLEPGPKNSEPGICAWR